MNLIFRYDKEEGYWIEVQKTNVFNDLLLVKLLIINTVFVILCYFLYLIC